MRQPCGHESTAEDDVLPPDSADAPRNTVPSLPSPLTFDRQHAARSKLQWRFSFNIQNVRLREVGRAFSGKRRFGGRSGATEGCPERSRRSVPMNYVRLIPGVDLSEQMPG